MNFISTNTTPITKLMIQNAARELDCEPAAIEAVSMTEAPNGGFISAPDNRPVILFESHSFHTLTKGQYDKSVLSKPNLNYDSNLDISTPTWIHNYGAAGTHQYDRLLAAMTLDSTAALESASWGKYQIMGSNFYTAGFSTVEFMVEAMVACEQNHLEAFVSFILNTDMAEYLANKDWSHFALHYNGVGQIDYYANKIEQNYLLAVKNGWNNS